MKILGLRDLPPSCFEGVVPAILATCAADGTPNATWLSQVYWVDEHHVALSCQFFRKTRANLASRPDAQLLIPNSNGMGQWQLDVRFARSETSGPTFESMRKRIEAIASLTRMEGVFALRSADVFEVLAVRAISVDVPAEAEASSTFAPASERGALAGDPFSALARLTEGIAACSDLGSLVESGLGFLATHLRYETVSLYLLEESEGVLYALASRGFARSGVGARLALGVGVVGSCAQHRMPIRIADAAREIRYSRAVKEQMDRVNEGRDREIPLPGLDMAASLLAVPLVLEGKVFGVLATESRRRLAFGERDVQLLSVAGHLLAQGIALHQEDAGEREATAPAVEERGPTGLTRVRYYEADDSVFIDGEYLIKGLPGRILWLVLSLRESEGRSTFLNRELRLHPVLKLPSYKDNLETRLLMLQRRLDEKGGAIRIDREQRGRVRIACATRVELERVSAKG